MEKGLLSFPRPLTNTGIVNVKDYGVKGDGVTNDATALNALISRSSAGTTLYFPQGTYRLTGVVTVSKQLHFTGQYPLIKPVGNQQAFQVTSTGTNSKFSFMRFQGEGKNTASRANQYGIYFNAAGGGQTVACEFTDFPGGGFAFGNTHQSANLGGTITACSFRNNKIAVDSLARGEYYQLIGCDINSNDTGFNQIGGNNEVVGCNFNYCGVGAKIDSGTNNAHGVFAACNFNHCTTYGIDFRNFTIGQKVSNCHVYESPININTTTGLSFENCTLDAGAYTITSGLNTIFRNCQFANTYGGTYTATTSEVAFIGCFNVDGRVAYDPKTFSNTYAKAYGAGTVTTTNATTTTAGTIDLVLNSGGKYRIELVARNTSNNDTWVAEKIAAVQVDGTGTGAIIGATTPDLFTPISDAGMVTCAATADISGDTLRVRVTGIAATTIKWDYRITPLIV